MILYKKRGKTKFREYEVTVFKHMGSSVRVVYLPTEISRKDPINLEGIALCLNTQCHEPNGWWGLGFGQLNIAGLKWMSRIYSACHFLLSQESLWLIIPQNTLFYITLPILVHILTFCLRSHFQLSPHAHHTTQGLVINNFGIVYKELVRASPCHLCIASFKAA